MSLALLSGTFLLFQCGPSALHRPVVDSVKLRAHIGVLAADSLRGRATPSPGLKVAAGYLAREMEAARLAPLGSGGSYLQSWPFVRRRLLGDRVAVRFGPRSAPESLRHGQDFFFISAGRPQVQAPIVFRGALERDSVFDPSVSGTVILSVVGTSKWFSPVHRAMAWARAAGAVGMIVILDSVTTPAQVAANRKSTQSMEHSADGVPTVLLRGDLGARLLTQAGYSLDLLRPASSPKPLPNLMVHVAAPIEADSTVVENVVGMLRGSDPVLRDEYVVVSAHYDHLGVGDPIRGDSVYNGADDNASGTAALLEVASVLSRLPDRPKRSIIFLATSGEEQGIVGSEYFVAHPPVDRSRIVADINIDGIGRAWQRDTVSAEGQSYSDLGRSIRRAVSGDPSLGLTVVDDQWPTRRYFETSDQIRFADAGIPSVFFSSTGPDVRYHQVTDETASVVAGFSARVATLVARTVEEVANQPARPKWLDSAPLRFRKQALSPVQPVH